MPKDEWAALRSKDIARRGVHLDKADKAGRKATKPDDLPCKFCGSRNFTHRFDPDRNGESRVRRDCANCGRYVKYVSPKLWGTIKIDHS